MIDRPIRIILENLYDLVKKYEITNQLKAAQRYKNVKISSDKTKKQSDSFTQIKIEVKERTDACQKNLHIK